MLRQLPNGDWINPTSVVKISIGGCRDFPEVNIYLSGGTKSSVTPKPLDYEVAKKLRTEIANMVNEATVRAVNE